MATKKYLRTKDTYRRKSKKTKKRFYLYLIGLVFVGFIFLFFLTIFDQIFQPLNKGGEKRAEKVKVTVYFADESERFLLPETRYVNKETEALSQAREIIYALLDGSKTGKVNTFPPNVSLQDIRIEKDTALISFDENLAKYHPGGSSSEMTTVYSLANSLIANIPAIKKVKILISGRETPSLKGHLDLRHPFAFNKEFISPVTAGEKKE